jgi:hypothetical protein
VPRLRCRLSHCSLSSAQPLSRPLACALIGRQFSRHRQCGVTLFPARTTLTTLTLADMTLTLSTHTRTHTGATLVDIACDPELVKLSKSIGNVPVCVSSVEPEEFLAAVAAGADMVEIGNYDSFYFDGRIFSAEEVLGLTVRTREILGAGVPLSVTVPHTLPLDEQVSLAMELEAAGAHVIQTEVQSSPLPAL